MSEQNPTQDLNDILRYCQYVLDDADGVDLERYLENRQIRFLVERSLIVIGEVAAHLRNTSPDVYERVDSFHLAIGLRNRLAHGYDELISNESIWYAVQSSIPRLIIDIEAVLNSPSP